MAVNFRVDKLPRQDRMSQYRVPVGMNTIIHVSAHKPSRQLISNKYLHLVNDRFSLVFSKWDAAANDFIVYEAIEIAPV